MSPSRPLDDAKVPEWRRYATELEQEVSRARADRSRGAALGTRRVVLHPMEGEMPSTGFLRSCEPYVYFAGQLWRVVVEAVPGLWGAVAVQGDDPAESAPRQSLVLEGAGGTVRLPLDLRTGSVTDEVSHE